MLLSCELKPLLFPGIVSLRLRLLLALATALQFRLLRLRLCCFDLNSLLVQCPCLCGGRIDGFQFRLVRGITINLLLPLAGGALLLWHARRHVN